MVDRDTIELTNLHRQTLYSNADIGLAKVDAAASRLKKLNPDVDIKTMPISVNRRSARSVVRDSDVVIDALDSVDARYALNEACVDAGIPFVSGGAVGTSGQVFVVVPGKTACYECIFPGLDDEQMPSCGIEGVNPAILSVIGGLEVAEAVRILCGMDPATLGSVLHVDIAMADFVKVRMGRVGRMPDVRERSKAPGGGWLHHRGVVRQGRKKDVCHIAALNTQNTPFRRQDKRDGRRRFGHNYRLFHTRCRS